MYLSDLSGYLVLYGLPAGVYEFYAGDKTSEQLVESGDPRGFLFSATLAPAEMVEYELAF